MGRGHVQRALSASSIDGPRLQGQGRPIREEAGKTSADCCRNESGVRLMRGLRQATRVTCRAGLRCGLSNNGWDILENSSVQPTFRRIIPGRCLCIPASDASPKTRKTPNIVARSPRRWQRCSIIVQTAHGMTRWSSTIRGATGNAESSSWASTATCRSRTNSSIFVRRGNRPSCRHQRATVRRSWRSKPRSSSAASPAWSGTRSGCRRHTA